MEPGWFKSAHASLLQGSLIRTFVTLIYLQLENVYKFNYLFYQAPFTHRTTFIFNFTKLEYIVTRCAL